MQEDDHLLAVWRYIERNALRAGLVGCAGDWRWSSLWLRRRAVGPAWRSEGRSHGREIGLRT